MRRSPHTSYRWREREYREPIKCMRLTTHQLQVERRESHRANQVVVRSPHTATGGEGRGQEPSSDALPHTSYRWRGERVIEPIKWMRSPHTSYRWRGRRDHRANQVYALATHQLQVERRESHRANQVYALTTHQLQVERRESHRANQVMRSPHTSYRWRGERVIEPIKCMRSTHQLQVERRESHRANQGCAPPHQLQVERRESHRANQGCAHTPATGGEERDHRANQVMRSPHTSYRWRGERVIEPIKCMRSPHTSYRWRGERVIEPIK